MRSFIFSVPSTKWIWARVSGGFGAWRALGNAECDATLSKRVATEELFQSHWRAMTRED